MDIALSSTLPSLELLFQYTNPLLSNSSLESTEMASSSSFSMRSQQPNYGPPPKRGQIKAQIFESVAETFVSMALKAGESLIKTKQSSASFADQVPKASD